MLRKVKIALLFQLLSIYSAAQSYQEWQKVTFDTKEVCEIEFEDGVFLSDFGEPNDTIRAAVHVVNDVRQFSVIKLSKAELVHDTLRIILYTTVPAYHHEYEIAVVDGKYFIKYRFSGGGGIFDAVLNPIETKLKLNARTFCKGQVIRGYTFFKTNCIYPCSKGTFVASGNFKVILR